MPRLGPLGPLSPLPTPFGPRHQHKGVVWEGEQCRPSPLGGGAGGAEAQGVLGSVAARLLQEGHRSVNQLPQGPSLAPPTTRCSTGR